jgi:hypothetical protein
MGPTNDRLPGLLAELHGPKWQNYFLTILNDLVPAGPTEPLDPALVAQMDAFVAALPVPDGMSVVPPEPAFDLVEAVTADTRKHRQEAQDRLTEVHGTLLPPKS